MATAAGIGAAVVSQVLGFAHSVFATRIAAYGWVEKQNHSAQGRRLQRRPVLGYAAAHQIEWTKMAILNIQWA
jgi:hypothetical protein